MLSLNSNQTYHFQILPTPTIKYVHIVTRPAEGDPRGQPAAAAAAADSGTKNIFFFFQRSKISGGTDKLRASDPKMHSGLWRGFKHTQI